MIPTGTHKWVQKANVRLKSYYFKLVLFSCTGINNNNKKKTPTQQKRIIKKNYEALYRDISSTQTWLKGLEGERKNWAHGQQTQDSCPESTEVRTARQEKAQDSPNIYWCSLKERKSPKSMGNITKYGSNPWICIFKRDAVDVLFLLFLF